MARHWKLRAGTLLAAGTYGLHQLRYALAYGGDSSRELASQGHAYLVFAAPLLAVMLVLCVLELAHRVAGRPADRGAGVTPRLRALWAIATAAFVATYSAQELIEGTLSRGHPGGFAGVFDHGGWIAIPLAVAFGLVVALLLRGAARVLELAAEPELRIAPPQPLLVIPRSREAFALGISAIARHVGGRGPPVPSV